MLKADDLIKNYDHLLQDHDEVEEKVKNVVDQLTGYNIQKIVFFMKDPNNEETKPYKNVMEKVCSTLCIKIEVENID